MTSEPDIVLKISFQLDQDKLYRLLTHPEHMIKWWGMELMLCPMFDIDLRTKGAWMTTFEDANREHFKVSGKIEKVKAPEHLEFTWAWHDQKDKRGKDSHVCMTLQPKATGGCELNLTHDGLEGEKNIEQHMDIWTNNMMRLDKLARKIAREALL